MWLAVCLCGSMAMFGSTIACMAEWPRDVCISTFPLHALLAIHVVATPCARQGLLTATRVHLFATYPTLSCCCIEARNTRLSDHGPNPHVHATPCDPMKVYACKRSWGLQCRMDLGPPCYRSACHTHTQTILFLLPYHPFGFRQATRVSVYCS